MIQKLSLIGQLLAFTVQDSGRILRSWRLLLPIVGGQLLLGLALVLLTPLIHTQLGTAVLCALLVCGYFWIVAPYLVVLIRFVSGGETASPESMRKSEVVKLFFAWSAVMTFVLAVPSVVYALLSDPGPVYYTGTQGPPPNSVRTLGTLVSLAAVTIFTIRVVTLLPSIALRGEGSLRRALSDTRGNFWFIVGAMALPMTLVTIGTALLSKIGEGLAGVWLSLPISLLSLGLYALVAFSLPVRLYQLLAQPAED